MSKKQDSWITAAPKPLEGATTVDDNMKFEVEALSHVAVGALASQIAVRIKEMIRPNAPVRIIFLNEGLAHALEFHQSFLAQLGILKSSFLGAAQAAEQGLKPLPKKGQKPSKAFRAPSGSGAASITAVGAVSAAVNLLALFRQDTNYYGRKVEISEPALVVELARHLNEIEGVSFRWLGLGLSAETFLGSTLSPRFLTELQDVMGDRDEATGKIHRLAVAIGNLPKNDAKIKPAQFALDQAHELHDSADGILRQLTSSLSNPDQETGVAPIQLLKRASELQTEIIQNHTKLYLLYARVETAGGSYRVRRNLFRTLFLGDGVSFSGGSVASFALFEPDGEFVLSGNLRRREAFLSFERMTTNFELRARRRPFRRWSFR